MLEAIGSVAVTILAFAVGWWARGSIRTTITLGEGDSVTITRGK